MVCLGNICINTLHKKDDDDDDDDDRFYSVEIRIKILEQKFLKCENDLQD